MPFDPNSAKKAGKKSKRGPELFNMNIVCNYLEYNKLMTKF